MIWYGMTLEKGGISIRLRKATDFVATTAPNINPMKQFPEAFQRLIDLTRICNVKEDRKKKLLSLFLKKKCILNESNEKCQTSAHLISLYVCILTIYSVLSWLTIDDIIYLLKIRFEALE